MFVMEIDAKGILYSVLTEMDKNKIESNIASNPSQISTIIKEVFAKCTKLLNSYADYDKPKVYGGLAEALMHYLLTVVMIPSERKVKYDDIELDLVIPTLKQLQTDPKRTLVISFPKCLDINDINMRLDKLLKAQPNKNNIWLVFGYHDGTFDSYKGFTVFVQDGLVKEPFKPLSRIVDEIKLFVETNKIKSFRIFRT